MSEPFTGYTPIIPNSPEEEKLEQEVFDFLYNQEDVRIPPEVEVIIKNLWGQFVARESWYKPEAEPSELQPNKLYVVVPTLPDRSSGETAPGVVQVEIKYDPRGNNE